MLYLTGTLKFTLKAIEDAQEVEKRMYLTFYLMMYLCMNISVQFRFFSVMICKYTGNIHNNRLIVKKYNHKHTKTRSRQNGICLVGLRI